MNKKLLQILWKAFIIFLDAVTDMLAEENGTSADADEGEKVQDFIFPMKYLRVTQGELTGSHIATKAMDFGGKDTGIDPVYRPADIEIMRVRPGANGEVYVQTIAPVKFRDGTIDYGRMLLLHDNTAEKRLKVGQIIKQGDVFYYEGNLGGGNAGAVANHVHIECGKGKWKEVKHKQTAQGTFSIENPESLYKMFKIPSYTIKLDSGGYMWK